MQRFLAALTATGMLLSVTPVHAAPTVAECLDAFENAQRAQKNGHLVFASKLVQECVAPACPAAVRNDCTQMQSSLERSIATVTIVVRNAAGADVPSTIKVDGAPFDGSAGRAVPIDPGPHQLQYTVGSETKLSSVTIAEGEKSRVIVLSASDEPPAPVPQPAAEAPARASIVGPAIVGGVGALSILAGVGAFVMSSKQASDADDQRAISEDPSKTQALRDASERSAASHDDAASNDRTIGFVLGAAGLAMIGTAIVWYVLTKPAPAKQARLSPVFTF